MFSEQSKRWLPERFPQLVCNEGGAAGTVSFQAAFSSDTNRFQIIYPGDSNEIGGNELAGTFSLKIQPRLAGLVPRLPAVTIDGHPHDKSRHISLDGTACLCSPFIEHEYLTPELDVRRLMEELVLPFLYGQLYYDGHKSWPWTDYAHGLTGLIESYTPVRSKEELRDRLTFMADYPSEWSRVRKLIAQRKPPNDSSPCVCGSNRRMGHCHPSALTGVLAIRSDRKKYRP